MNLAVPSGAVIAVHEPSLRAVLLGDGSAAALIEAVWEQEMDAELLQEADVFFLSTWCVRELGKDVEAPALAQVCRTFRQVPSQRLGIDDPILAFECDAVFVRLALGATETVASEETEEAEQEEHIRFTVPDPGDG